MCAKKYEKNETCLIVRTPVAEVRGEGTDRTRRRWFAGPRRLAGPLVFLAYVPLPPLQVRHVLARL